MLCRDGNVEMTVNPVGLTNELSWHVTRLCSLLVSRSGRTFVCSTAKTVSEHLIKDAHPFDHFLELWVNGFLHFSTEQKQSVVM